MKGSVNQKWEEHIAETKSYQIDKKAVWEAWKQVKRKGGGPGIDGQSIEEFERDVKDNLYKIWNRMSSGSYFPPAVKECEIPKADGGRSMRPIPERCGKRTSFG